MRLASGIYPAGYVMGVTFDTLGDFSWNSSSSISRGDRALNLVLSKEKPGSYTGLENDPGQAGECLSRCCHANSGSEGFLVSQCREI